MSKPRTYKMTLGFGEGKRTRKTLLVLGEGDCGYLWLPSESNGCHGWIDQKQLDAIAIQWCRHRGLQP